MEELKETIRDFLFNKTMDELIEVAQNQDGKFKFIESSMAHALLDDYQKGSFFEFERLLNIFAEDYFSDCLDRLFRTPLLQKCWWFIHSRKGYRIGA